MTRLTDEQLEGMSRWAEEPDLPAFAMYCGPLAATELRARRAADLSKEDVEALRIVREEVVHTWDNTGFRTRALAVLSKLIGGRDA